MPRCRGKGWEGTCMSQWWRTMRTKGEGSFFHKGRTEVGVGQEQLAGEKRHETAYSRSRNLWTTLLKSKFVWLCLLGHKSHAVSLSLILHAVPARNLSQTHHLCDAARSDDNPDVNTSVTVCRLRCNVKEAEPISQSRKGWFCFCGP